MTGPGSPQTAPFARAALVALGLVSIISFIGYVVLSAYAGDLDPGQDGSEHALSRSAVGYAGIVRLMNAVSPGSAHLSRGHDELFGRGLNVVTLEPGQAFTQDDYYNFGEPILIVAPKWAVLDMRQRRGWVERGRENALLSHFEIVVWDDGYSYSATIRQDRPSGADDDDLAVGVDGAPTTVDQLVLVRDPDLDFDDPSDYVQTALFDLDLNRSVLEGPFTGLQTLSGEGFTPILVDVKGRAVLARVGYGEMFILSDPDLLNNMGVANLSRAGFAVDLLSALSHDNGPVFFDLTKHGFERSRNMLKLAFEPPFGAATLTAFLAALVLAWRASVRFGPTREEKRAYALGKRALADNSASLIRMAGREHRYGESYADLMRRLAARAVGSPRELHGDALDRFLDRYAAARAEHEDDAPHISDLRKTARNADSRAGLMAAARRLFSWKQEFDRERR